MSFDPIPLEPKTAPANPNTLFRPVPVSGVEGGGGGDSVEWNDLVGIPDYVIGAQIASTESIRSLGTGATQAAPGDHTHEYAGITGLQDALDAKAPATHTHTIAQVTGLQDALNALSLRLDDLEA